ncbi:Phospho-2-dehydro-3-deoxyheptonate aldolase, Phe-sensitive, partial [Haemophilus influenzae]
CSYC